MDADAVRGARLTQLRHGECVCIIKGRLTGTSGVIVAGDAGQRLVKLDAIEDVYVTIAEEFLRANRPTSPTK